MLTILKKVLFFLLSITLIAACGESSHQSTSKKGSSLKGNVANGYIQEASVCLDLDYSNNCNNNEPVADKDENGTYSFSDLDITEPSLVPVLALNSQKKLRTIVKISPDEDLQNIVISPLTDLTATYFLNSSKKNSLDLLDAQNLIISNFNISSYQLEQDPINSRTLFIVTQKIFYTAMLVESVIYKNMSTIGTIERQVEVQEIIKGVLLQNTTDTSIVLLSLETTLGIVIPLNEKKFIEMQIEELYLELNTISFNNAIDALKSTQEYLSQQFIIINERLKVIDGDYIVEIVDLNISF